MFDARYSRRKKQKKKKTSHKKIVVARNKHSNNSVDRVDLPWDRRLSMAKDTAKGIAFLHGSDPPTLHNDLKSSNLLVNHNWLCKVSDFGLTSLKGSRTQVCKLKQDRRKRE